MKIVKLMGTSNPIGECLYCGRKISYKARFCRACGKPNDGWREIAEGQCGNCHEWLEEGDRYCRICGTKVGKGAYKPYQELMQCIYGPMPIEREHVCRKCGFTWTTYLMVDEGKYCPKCGKRLKS